MGLRLKTYKDIFESALAIEKDLETFWRSKDSKKEKGQVSQGDQQRQTQPQQQNF